TVLLNEVSVGAGSALSTNVADRVTISTGALVNKYPCNWCPASENSSKLYFHEDYIVSSTAQRIAWSGSGAPPADATVLGQKTLSATFRMEPVEASTSQLTNSGSGSGNN